MTRPSIRQQTLLIAMLPMLLAVILLDSYFIYARFRSMETEMLERAQLLARQVASSGEYALYSGNTELLQRDVARALKQKDVVVVAIQDTSHKVIAYAGDPTLESEGDFIGRDSDTRLWDASDHFWIKEPIDLLAIDLGDFDSVNEAASTKLLGYVLIKMSKFSLQRAKWEVLGASLLISTLLLALTVFLVLRISRRIVNPIKALNQVVRGIGEGVLEMRLASSPAVLELNELASGVNEMAKQLQQDRMSLNVQTELLRENEERLNEIITTMPVALFIKDTKSRIVLMNNACEAQWGVLFADVVGTDARRFFPAEQVDAFLANDQEVFAARKMVNFEELVWNSQIGANRTLHTFKKAIYDHSGSPIYLIGISIDITERKLAEERLRLLNEQLETRVEAATRELRLKKEEAENANYDKTRFLAAASHDLRQPMHALGLFVSELYAKLTTPEQRQVVGKVEESVDALSNLLDALLDISKLDAGVVTPNVTAFSVETLLGRIAHDYVPLAERKGLSLRVVKNRTVVSSDPILLERMLVNLVTNAIRYTPVGGRVVIGCRNQGDKLRIEVRDNGIGIPANEQQSVFREFVQLANKERDRSKGLGLGLAIVERIARLLGCEVAVCSAVNQGSTFSILVPKRAAGVHEPEAEYSNSDASEQQGGLNDLSDLDVLVVEDNPLVSKGMQGVIQSWGCRVSMAASVKEVQDVHSNADFDLVICDYRLPDGDGIEMADWIKMNFRTQPIFILVSGDTSPEVLQTVNEHGVHLLHKPVRPAKLRSLIQFLLNQKKAGA